jgi:hypothetical protein
MAQSVAFGGAGKTGIQLHRSVVQVATPQPKKSVSSVQIGQPSANAAAIVFVAAVYTLSEDAARDVTYG